ncbi:MAG: hypothetical protein C5B60_01140, partial [Chloroflexi bacterium]
MQRVMTRSPLIPPLWAWILQIRQRIEGQPVLASRVLIAAWCLTRGLLFIGLLISRSYCDPQFYNYAGKLASGQWPYTPAVPVEYPPFAMVLILLPALPLLPFAAVAPRPDPAFAHVTTHLPIPDPVRYGAYGISFAVEMLLIDAATLWLVQRAARRYVPGDSTGLRSGLLYIVLAFLSGAILQKFELAAGLAVLAALVALVSGRYRLSYILLALATLIKGYPILAIPILVGCQLCQSSRSDLRYALAEQVRPILEGLMWFAATIGAWTLLVLWFAGGAGVAHSILYHGSRGTEIESLYANAILLVGWLPGVHVYTIFNAQDLSRIVKSSFDHVVDIVSLLLLAVSLVLAYGAFWRARGRFQSLAGRKPAESLLQLAGSGMAAILLAFMLSFRALPAHYLLAIVPIAALVRLPRPGLQRIWLASLVAVAASGQVMAIPIIWHSLVGLLPAAVLLLTLRNCAWILVFGILVV